MNNHRYVDEQIEKIIKDENLEFPKNMAMAASWIIGHFKGFDLKILDVREKSSLADYFVLSSASNSIQAKTMVNEISKQMKKYGNKIISREGLDGSDWILLDLGDLLVHIFLGQTARQSYGLERLWGHAPSVEIPESYALSSTSSSSPDNETFPPKGYY